MRNIDVIYCYEQYAKELFAYGKAICCDRDIVLDAMQDVFLHLCEKNEIENTNNIKSFLFVSLKNRLISIMRHESHGQELTSDFLLYVDTSDVLDNEEEQKHYEKQVNELLSLLTNRQREAIYLYYIQNLSNKEVAQILNITPKSTRNIIYSAVKKMRERYPFYLILLINVQYFGKFLPKN